MPLSPYFNIGGGGGGVSYGNPFVLFDTSGEATSYATYADAVAVAVAGQTIHMVTDVTETSATECILKDGVDINLNGNTYTLNVASTENAFTDNNVQVKCNIYNGTIKRQGGTNSISNSLCIRQDNQLSNIRLEGANAYSTFGCTCFVDGIFSGGFYRSDAGSVSFYASTTSKISDINANAFGYVRIDGQADFVHSRSSNERGVLVATSTICTNIVGVSTASYGISFSGSGILKDSNGTSFADFGIWHSGSGTAYECNGYSTASIGFLQGASTGYAFKCSGDSTANIGYSAAGENQGCQGVSSASVAVRVTGGKFYGGDAYNKWNNSGGHAFQSTSLNSEIFGCTGIVTNSAAFGVYVNNLAFNCFFGNNSFEGCLQVLSTGFAGVVNLQINAPDIAGNILKG